MRTYDILNSGPRNRFMANGRIVSNSGSGVQVQNMPRPIKTVESDVDSAIQLIENLDYEGIQKKYGSVIDVVGSCVRSAFQAHDGDILNVCDLGAIENRVLGWVSGCDAILDVFRNGLDPYVAFAVKMYKQPYEILVKDKAKRQIAKPAVLGAGYGLGGGEMMPNKYGDIVKTGLWGYAENMGVKMTQEEAHLSVKIFRDSYPEVVQFWRSLQTAAINTIRFGVDHEVGFVKFDYVDTKKLKVLRIILPSGRPLHYLNPRLEQITKIFKTREGEKETIVDQILYDGMGHGVGKIQEKWGPVKTYSGKLCENIVQAISRDILLNAMFLADEMGAKIGGHFHDEILTISRKDDPFAFNLSDLKACMSESPIWAPGLLLTAEGYRGKFYKKG